MNALETRKQLLIAESELNRAQLLEEWHGMKGAVANQARSVQSIALTTASLIAGLMFLKRAKAPAADGKSSWWRSLLRGAQWAASLWWQFKPRPKS
jgi:hypothetical protein